MSHAYAAWLVDLGLCAAGWLLGFLMAVVGINHLAYLLREVAVGIWRLISTRLGRGNDDTEPDDPDPL